MKKLSCLLVLFVSGCASIFEDLLFDSLNTSSRFYFHDKQVLISSCKQLKSESYDVFYSNENQKCLTDNAEQIRQLTDKIAQTKELVEKEKLISTLLKSYQRFDKCKLTKNLSVGDLIKDSRTWSDSQYSDRDRLMSYFAQAYQICDDIKFFDKNTSNPIMADYMSIAQQKERNDQKIQELEKQKTKIFSQNLINKKMAKLLSEINNNPILSKMQQVAPDFISTQVNECPIAFFIQILKQNVGTFYSDFAYAKNYKFKKKDSDTLILSVGDFKYTFVKTEKNSVDVAIMRGIDEAGETFTSKYTYFNNAAIASLCRTYLYSDEDN